MKHFITAKFLTHLNQQIYKYSYILGVASKQKLI